MTTTVIPDRPNGAGNPVQMWGVFTSTTAHNAICPDLITADKLGEADRWRGRLILAFVRLLDRLGI